MTTPQLTVLLLSVAVLIALVAFVVWFVRSRNRTLSVTQHGISDRELLLRISREPDGFVTADSISRTTELTKNEARIRLQSLSMAGILDQAHNPRLQGHYSLRHHLGEPVMPDLSPEPFLTVEDLVTIFELHGMRPRDQDLIVSTGLPLSLIRREMKYFMGEGVVDMLYYSEGYGKQSQRIYVLKEPYRSQPDTFLHRAHRDDLQLRTILRNDNFIV
ncbi:hypothetical protein [Lewinella sp. IMCC34183]|uniref:hypothetical protein n=1 Tax=Lewinella sp. IMCC34183 TaxID=2248762 RepID=UPI000E25A8DB|nr:hypothetical protein [Lewinella sp. IMCC34183]